MTGFDFQVTQDAQHIQLTFDHDSFPPHLADPATLILSTAHHKIWQHRNTIIHDNTQFSTRTLTQSITKSLARRVTMETKRPISIYMDVIRELYKYWLEK